jgi:hypothetical protein
MMIAYWKDPRLLSPYSPKCLEEEFSEVRNGKQLASKRKDHSFVVCANPYTGVCCNRYVGKGAWEKRWEVKTLAKVEQENRIRTDMPLTLKELEAQQIELLPDRIEMRRRCRRRRYRRCHRY